MKRKWILMVVVIVLVVGGTIVWQTRRSRGPSYEGESLAVWARRLPSQSTANAKGIVWSSFPLNGVNEESKAEHAIRQMGTNALPALLQMMRTEEPFLNPRIEGILRWVRSRLSGQPMRYGSEMSPAERRRWDAAVALHVLGPVAKPAVPELAVLLTNGVHSRDAAYALAAIGPEALDPLRQAMTNRNDWIQMCAIWALGQTPTNGRLAVPALLDRLHDKSYTVRFGAAWSLGQIHADPELVAPALAANLGDTGFNVRAMTEGALKEYGITSVTNSALVRYLSDPQLHIRMAATNALKALDPEAAAKAGVK